MLTKFLVTTVTSTHTTYEIYEDGVKKGEQQLDNAAYKAVVAKMKFASSPESRFEEDRLLVQGADGTTIRLTSEKGKDPNA